MWKHEYKKRKNTSGTKNNISAADILGNPKYLAISYGGFRQTSRDIEPTIVELKEDMRILSAMGIKIIRTYNVQKKLQMSWKLLVSLRKKIKPLRCMSC
jgi:hypothetical protein